MHPGNMVNARLSHFGYWEGRCGCVLQRQGPLHQTKDADPELKHRQHLYIFQEGDLFVSMTLFN